jgi:hypothetical protein
VQEDYRNRLPRPPRTRIWRGLLLQLAGPLLLLAAWLIGSSSDQVLFVLLMLGCVTYLAGLFVANTAVANYAGQCGYSSTLVGAVAWVALGFGFVVVLLVALLMKPRPIVPDVQERLY